MYFSIKYRYRNILLKKHKLHLLPFALLQSHLLLCWHGFCDVSICVSNAHTPRNTLSKSSGRGKEILLWSFAQNESDIKLNFVLYSSAYTQKFSSNISLYWEANIFTSDNGVLVLFCFLKTIFILGH